MVVLFFRSELSQRCKDTRFFFQEQSQLFVYFFKHIKNVLFRGRIHFDIQILIII